MTLSLTYILTLKVDFHPMLTDQKARDDHKIEIGQQVLSGESNGLSVWLDVEAFDHGYVPAKGSGVFMVVNHHGDKPILNSGRIKLQVGIMIFVPQCNNNLVNPSLARTQMCRSLLVSPRHQMMP